MKASAFKLHGDRPWTTYLNNRETETALDVSGDWVHEARLLLGLQDLSNAFIPNHLLLLVI